MQYKVSFSYIAFFLLFFAVKAWTLLYVRRDKYERYSRATCYIYVAPCSETMVMRLSQISANKALLLADLQNGGIYYYTPH